MRLLFLAIFLLCCAVPVYAQEEGRPPALHVAPNLIDPQYTVCQRDDECVVVTPPCAAPMTFNKKHQLFLQGYFSGTATSFACPDWLKIPRVKKTECVKQKCAIELTEPQPPPPQTKFDTEPQYCEKDSDCETVIGDCCAASFYNHTHAFHKRAEMEYKKDAPKSCFGIDKRKVVNLRCQDKKCTADLEVPLELDYQPHELKDCTRWK
jgi:hypothetical protein